MTPMPHRTVFLLAWTAMLLVTSAATADIVPLLDLRQMHVKAIYGGTDEHTCYPPSAFAPWNETCGALVSDPEAGQSDASAYQNSQLYRDGNGVVTGFFHAGGCAGEYQVGSGSFEALTLTTMVFQLTTTSDYFLDATVEPGDPGSDGGIVIGNPHGAPQLTEVISGHVLLQGRLAPGDYFVEGRSQITSVSPAVGGPGFALFLTASPTNSPFIQIQPSNIVIPPGGNGNLSATTGTPSPGTAQEGTTALTFQWRKNGVPLANGGHYSGVTTNTLSITSASASADTGWFNLIVTSGSIQEPSRYVRVAVGVTGVEPGVPSASLRFTLEPAAPNPSAATTSFRFSTAQPVEADAAVYDATGRRVRAVSSGLLSGEGVLRWDGRSEAGERAPAGIYFLRVRVAGETHVRRFVRMRS
jgi:hypothetical protein